MYLHEMIGKDVSIFEKEYVFWKDVVMSRYLSYPEMFTLSLMLEKRS